MQCSGKESGVGSDQGGGTVGIHERNGRCGGSRKKSTMESEVSGNFSGRFCNSGSWIFSGEYGSGDGALSGFFCHGFSVVCVSGSKRIYKLHDFFYK